MFGVKPITPNTGYGYIRYTDSASPVKPIRGFVEKPGYDDAMSFMASGEYCWSAGIFLVRADVLLAALNEYAPDILQAARKSVSLQRIDGNSASLDFAAFSECRSDSIDYSVLEKYPNIGMVVLESGWSDVGNWNSFAELMEPDKDGNRFTGLARIYDSKSSYVHAPHRLTVVIGLNELLVVDTIDALLIASKDKVESIKNVVDELQRIGVPQATEHRYATRPWGRYEILDEGPGFKVKRISVNPESSLSLQIHRHRAEHWVVVRGTAVVTRGEESFVLMANQSAYIPSGTKHRLENTGGETLEIIEIQSGDYLGEDDIERFDDHYGRS
jgi:mannose-1-phosphate guanylyltransferase/mannose-6-phosphate isomerase